MDIKLRLIFMAIMSFYVQAGQGPDLYFPSFEEDEVYILENTYLNITFWLNTSSSEGPSKVYRLEIETKRSDGTYEYDGRLVSRNNKCLITYEHAVHCTSDQGPAELYKIVNRSHEEITFRWSWTDVEQQIMKTRQRTVKLKILCKQDVTPLKENCNEKRQGLNKEQWATVLLAETIICVSIFSLTLAILKSGIWKVSADAASLQLPDRSDTTA
ncbi:hypothetical protein C0Q70_12524 [Pomacea canaliculata]|uniref:GOLD domain-containing protein n=1 Tax=Pomacea canaliculata TaxID=400727 RepID=A0A2T7P1R6_POMCA|nr:hypothetical protein C0Q70_12524 [Pomacea canaliculata]